MAIEHKWDVSCNLPIALISIMNSLHQHNRVVLTFVLLVISYHCDFGRVNKNIEENKVFIVLRNLFLIFFLPIGKTFLLFLKSPCSSNFILNVSIPHTPKIFHLPESILKAHLKCTYETNSTVIGVAGNKDNDVLSYI